MKDRLFLDANVLFSAAYRPNFGLLVFWRLPGVDLISSSYAVDEARRNLNSLQNTDLGALLDNVRVVNVARIDIKLDQSMDLPEKDKPILFAAIHSKSTHLITGDITHFGALFNSEIHGVLIMNPAGYMKSRQALS